MSMATLERALFLAVTAHLGQVDKAGAPYILHPLRLMLRATDDETRMVALLHDTVEDTAVTLAQLCQEGFPDAVLTAVDLLTHRPEHSYGEYIARLQGNPLAVRVKLLDLADNMDLRRLAAKPSDKDQRRMEKYAHYSAVLQAVASSWSSR